MANVHGRDDHDGGGTRAAADPDQQEWDERYAGEGDDALMWSGQPNGALVDEVADLEPGRALDVGCGEGADAVWLAERGWAVTGLDPSAVALGRAEAAATRVGVEVSWVRGGLVDQDVGDRYDLVVAMYPAVRHGAAGEAAQVLLGAVAPGGTLLFVHHDVDGDHHAEHDDRDHEHETFDPADYMSLADVRAQLDDGFEVVVDEGRPRSGPLPPDARHVRDVVLRLRRHT